jgi:putative YhbY family RNA-binding protein
MTALLLNSAQRSDLRSEAHGLNPTVMIGADGLTPAVMKEANAALNAHQLIKIRVFGDDREARIAIYEQLCDELGAAPIQHIGKLLVLYRPAQEAVDEYASLRKGKTSGKSGSRTPGHGAPQTLMVKKFTRNPMRRPKPVAVKVLGNERVAAGGKVKRAKPRQTSVKKRSLG